MSTYKYTYFNVRGRGELPRLIFAAANKKYEDNRLTFEAWPALKQSTPWGHLPVLEVGGKKLGESLAIAGFLAAEFGLAGQTSWDAALVRSVALVLHELKEKALPIFFVKDKQLQEEQKQEFLEKTAKPTLEKVESFLNSNSGDDGWFVGKQLTWADLQFYDTCEILGSMEPAVLAARPKLQAHVTRVEANPGVARWLKDRPQDKQTLHL